MSELAYKRTNVYEVADKKTMKEIFSYADGYKKFIRGNLDDKLLWLCTFKQPEKVVDYNWTILQYSHWGEVAGIDGEVDLDVFNGDRGAWQRWLQSL